MTAKTDPIDWAMMALQADDFMSAWSKAAEALGARGLEHCGFIFDQPIAQSAYPPDTRKSGALLDPDWELRLRQEPGLAAADPIGRRFRQRDCAVAFWPDSLFVQSLPEDDRAFLGNYQHYGVHAGAAWSSHDHLKRTAHVLVTWSDFTSRDWRETIARESTTLHLAMVYFSEGLRVKRLGHAAGGPVLAPREKECLLWSQTGQSSKQIAWRLSLSVATVNEYISGARRKLGASSRAQAAARATMLGLISP